MGGGCCWYRNGGGFGIGLILDGGQNPVFDRPRDPKSGLGWRDIEKNGLCVGGVGMDSELGINISLPRITKLNDLINVKLL